MAKTTNAAPAPRRNNHQALDATLARLQQEVTIMQRRLDASTPGQPSADAYRDLARVHRRIAITYMQIAEAEAKL